MELSAFLATATARLSWPPQSYSLLPTSTESKRSRSRALFTYALLVITLALALALVARSNHRAKFSSPPLRNRCPPTIAIYSSKLNQQLTEDQQYCEGHYWWSGTEGADPEQRRETTQASFAALDTVHVHPTDYPFTTTRQNQFSLGSILATRFASYPHSSPFAPNYPLGSDFIFYPLHSLFHSDDAGFCSYPGTRAVLIESVTNEIRALANELAEMAKVAGLDAYPRLVIPIATVRRFSNYKLLTQVIAEELKDKIVLLGIETDPLIYEDPLKYVVQVPYPTIYHFGKDDTQDWRRTSSDYFLDKPRPNLIHYAGSSSHSWQPDTPNAIHGFALRHVLATTLYSHLSLSPNASIIFDDFGSLTSLPNIEGVHTNMGKSVFSLEPAGDTPTRAGFYDALINGALPVVFRQSSYRQLFPNDPEMDHRLWTVFIDEKEIVEGVGRDVVSRLRAVPEKEIKEKQGRLREVVRKLQYSRPVVDRALPLMQKSTERLETHDDGGTDWGEDAFGGIMNELEKIREGNWSKRGP